MRLHVHEWGDPEAPRLVCLHGVSGHGRRFRRLAEERWAGRYRVVAPDLRGHGRSGWEPPWSIEQLLRDVVESVGEPATWLGHSLGGRMVLELASRSPELVERAVLLDPAIQILPGIALNLAEDQCRDLAFSTADEAIEFRRATVQLAPRAFLEEEMDEHLVRGEDGRLRYRYCRPAVASLYGELASPPPRPDRLSIPTLLLHAPDFGLVRERQIEELRSALGDLLEVVEVPGGHIVFWDAYDATADAIDAFLPGN